MGTNDEQCFTTLWFWAKTPSPSPSAVSTNSCELQCSLRVYNCIPIHIFFSLDNAWLHSSLRLHFNNTLVRSEIWLGGLTVHIFVVLRVGVYFFIYMWARWHTAAKFCSQITIWNEFELFEPILCVCYEGRGFYRELTKWMIRHCQLLVRLGVYTASSRLARGRLMN